MLDFYESLGRVIADDDVRSKLAASPDLATVNQSISGGIAFPRKKFDAVHGILDAKLVNKPLSIYAKSEFIRVMPLRSFRDLAPQLAAKVAPVSKQPSAEYLGALGALTVDTQFRSMFRATAMPAEVSDYFQLSADEHKNLKDLVLPQTPGSYDDLCEQICAESWSPVCGVKLFPYPGDTQHHAILKL